MKKTARITGQKPYEFWFIEASSCKRPDFQPCPEGTIFSSKISSEHLEFLFIFGQDSVYSAQIYSQPYWVVYWEIKTLHMNWTEPKAEANTDMARSFNAPFLVDLCFIFSCYTPWVHWGSYFQPWPVLAHPTCACIKLLKKQTSSPRFVLAILYLCCLTAVFNTAVVLYLKLCTILRKPIVLFLPYPGTMVAPRAQRTQTGVHVAWEHPLLPSLMEELDRRWNNFWSQTWMDLLYWCSCFACATLPRKQCMPMLWLPNRY